MDSREVQIVKDNGKQGGVISYLSTSEFFINKGVKRVTRTVTEREMTLIKAMMRVQDEEAMSHFIYHTL